MSSKLYSLLLLLIISILLGSCQATILTDTFAELEREIASRHTEIDADVFNDFKMKYKCSDCDEQTLDMLLNEFENYKRIWMNEMVDFIIK